MLATQYYEANKFDSSSTILTSSLYKAVVIIDTVQAVSSCDKEYVGYKAIECAFYYQWKHYDLDHNSIKSYKAVFF